MNKPDESYLSITFAPVGWQPPDFHENLSPQERREKTNRDIDNAEREIALIRQGIGKWPESTIASRLEGLLQYLEFSAGGRIDLTKIQSKAELFTVIEKRLLELRKAVSISHPPERTGKRTVLRSRWLLLVAGVWCAVLAFATFDHHWLYQLSRWVVCVVAIHGALKFETSWKWVLWTLVVLFNPIVPIHFGRNAWQVVDGLAAVTFFISSSLKK